jgi:hypothetical protein
MGAKDPAVLVDFVEYDVFERLKKPLPEPVAVGEEAIMQHVRGREEHRWLAIPDAAFLGLGEPAGVLVDTHGRAESETASERAMFGSAGDTTLTLIGPINATKIIDNNRGSFKSAL